MARKDRKELAPMDAAFVAAYAGEIEWLFAEAATLIAWLSALGVDPDSVMPGDLTAAERRSLMRATRLA